VTCLIRRFCLTASVPRCGRSPYNLGSSTTSPISTAAFAAGFECATGSSGNFFRQQLSGTASFRDIRDRVRVTASPQVVRIVPGRIPNQFGDFFGVVVGPLGRCESAKGFPFCVLMLRERETTAVIRSSIVASVGFPRMNDTAMGPWFVPTARCASCSLVIIRQRSGPTRPPTSSGEHRDESSRQTRSVLES